MSKVCEICSKKTVTGRSVSHSHRRTLRTFKPNLQKKRLVDEKTGEMVQKKACTRCMRTLVKSSS